MGPSVFQRIGWHSRGSTRRRGVKFAGVVVVVVVIVSGAQIFYHEQTFNINANTEIVHVRLSGPQESFHWYIGDAGLFLFREVEDERETVERYQVYRALIEVPKGYAVRFQRIARGPLDITLNRRDTERSATLFHRPSDSAGEDTSGCPGSRTTTETFEGILECTPG